MDPRFCEFEEEKLRSPACCRQENATFSHHIHRTWGPPFSPSLYLDIFGVVCFLVRPARVTKHGNKQRNATKYKHNPYPYSKSAISPNSGQQSEAVRPAELEIMRRHGDDDVCEGEERGTCVEGQ